MFKQKLTVSGILKDFQEKKDQLGAFITESNTRTKENESKIKSIESDNARENKDREIAQHAIKQLSGILGVK